MRRLLAAILAAVGGEPRLIQGGVEIGAPVGVMGEVRQRWHPILRPVQVAVPRPHFRALAYGQGTGLAENIEARHDAEMAEAAEKK